MNCKHFWSLLQKGFSPGSGNLGKLHLLRKELHDFNNDSVEMGHSELPFTSGLSLPNLISFSATGHDSLSWCGRWFSTPQHVSLRNANGWWAVCGLKSCGKNLGRQLLGISSPSDTLVRAIIFLEISPKLKGAIFWLAVEFDPGKRFLKKNFVMEHFRWFPKMRTYWIQGPSAHRGTVVLYKDW